MGCANGMTRPLSVGRSCGLGGGRGGGGCGGGDRSIDRSADDGGLFLPRSLSGANLGSSCALNADQRRLSGRLLIQLTCQFLLETSPAGHRERLHEFFELDGAILATAPFRVQPFEEGSRHFGFAVGGSGGIRNGIGVGQRGW